MIEVGSSTRGPSSLAHGPSGYVLAARVTGGFAKPFAFLLFRPEPSHRHEAQAIHEEDRGEAGIDRGNFLGHNLQIKVAYATAAILLRQKSHRKAELVALDIGALQHVKGFLGVGFTCRAR